ncbi:IS1595 family transposase [Flavobacterium beibuense]|uniref:IS1595 family transposase n=1 Tax=Flavobacterium beibuense TaxID=657326 RepID=UPI003A8FE065
MFNTNIKSIFDLMKTFPTEQHCIDYLENLMWSGTPVSPYNAEHKVYKCANNYYKDSVLNKRFNILTGTFMEGTKIPLQKWFIAVWLLTTSKKGLSSVNLAQQLGITQKSAWFLAHRIRAAFNIENTTDEKFSDNSICETDETFFGGKNKNRHKDKKVQASQGRSWKDKTAVTGVLQRGETEIVNGKKVQITNSKVKLRVTVNTKREVIQPFLKEVVEKHATLISDEWHGYKGLDNYFDHHIVDHGKKQYVDYDNPEIHSNSMESFWGIMKRSYNGIYNWWSRKHLFRYCDEHVYRFNLRGMTNNERFNYLFLNSTVRLKYKDLIA